MVGLQATHNPTSVKNGPRPVNLRTDLGPLADLIEIAVLVRFLIEIDGPDPRGYVDRKVPGREVAHDRLDLLC